MTPALTEGLWFRFCRLSLELGKSDIHVAEYLTSLPPRALLTERLQKAAQQARLQIAQHRPQDRMLQGPLPLR